MRSKLQLNQRAWNSFLMDIRNKLFFNTGNNFFFRIRKSMWICLYITCFSATINKFLITLPNQLKISKNSRMADGSLKLVCGDILQFQVCTICYFNKKQIFIYFQEQLQKMRELDEKIIYTLNMAIPTASIKARTDSNPGQNCQDLYARLKNSYANREKGIQECIWVTAEQVTQLKKQRESSDEIQLEKRFKSEQRKVSTRGYLFIEPYTLT